MSNPTPRATRWTASLAIAAVVLAACSTPTDAPALSRHMPAEGPAAGFNSPAVPAFNGWVADFSDDFSTGPRNQDTWEAYGGGQRPTGGAMGYYERSNVTIDPARESGTMGLRYLYRDGRWTSSGVSSRPQFSAVQGRWEFRAKFPRGKGLGYAFLLWPDNQQWPPEVDMAEGVVNGPTVSSFYHYGTAQDPRREARERQVPDMTQWHTYGVIMESDRLTYTFDGEPWATVDVAVTTTPLWIGFQTGAIDPKAVEAQWFEGGVTGGVPNAETPADATIQIDWVAHYRKA
ncbi:MAG: glycoside hydrolase family 16 protein [Propionibacteriales bacterium]|nr:glycoside hydrolase family 16 protein [Propionibacteriales bacterium]